MVSIGKINWLQGTSQVGQAQPASSGVHFGGGNSQRGGNTLQDRLAAIDRGEPAAFLSFSGSSKISSFGSNPAKGGSLLQRLDAIGTGELSPHYGSNEKKFDLTF